MSFTAVLKELQRSSMLPTSSTGAPASTVTTTATGATSVSGVSTCIASSTTSASVSSSTSSLSPASSSQPVNNCTSTVNSVCSANCNHTVTGKSTKYPLSSSSNGVSGGNNCAIGNVHHARAPITTIVSATAANTTTGGDVAVSSAVNSIDEKASLSSSSCKNVTVVSSGRVSKCGDMYKVPSALQNGVLQNGVPNGVPNGVVNSSGHAHSLFHHHLQSLASSVQPSQQQQNQAGYLHAHSHHLHASVSDIPPATACLAATLMLPSPSTTSTLHASLVPASVESVSAPINLQVTASDALRSAATTGDFDQVKLLCSQSVTIDADADGRTALHYASVNGHLQIVREIINAGAKVNVKDAVSTIMRATCVCV